MNILTILRCPLCRTTLAREDKSLRCEKGHCFDLAKEGYVNLLPPGKGKNARTGDEKDMLRARREFLAGEYYAPISDGIASLLHRYLPKGETVLCDSGCGEGWHTLRYTRGLSGMGDRDLLTVGFDASKYGAACGMKAARREGVDCEIGLDSRLLAYFFPGNLFALPLADGSVSAVISMFAPVAAEENRRILAQNGILLTAASGREHLREMRELLYTDVHYSDKEPEYEGFMLADHETVRYTVSLPDKAAIGNLFMMTPFYYKTTAEGREKLLAAETLTVTVETELRIYRRNDA
ncbi:MAG: hypothetical protein IJ480_01610 [Clostridia bacterium]|nr:hypothetical protein [Clostridia bacterium]